MVRFANRGHPSLSRCAERQTPNAATRWRLQFVVARAEGNALNERNQASPTIERSRLGPVRELRLPVVVEERQTHYAARQYAATRWRLQFLVAPHKQLRMSSGVS
jgi:hypothetical protein